jgi:hypothetical protein
MRILSPLLLVALCLAGCDEHRSGTSSVASGHREETSTVSPPTNDASYKLLEQDPDARLAALQAEVVGSGHPCARGVKAEFEGGLDGSDEWRVDCADSGPWAVWFRPADPPQVERCSGATCE